MKTVNAILRTRGIDPTDQGFIVEVRNEPYLPLVIKGIGSGPSGHPSVSVCQYTERAGSLLRDSEMRFEIIKDLESPDPAAWKPYYYRNDYVVCERTSTWINESGEVIVCAETLQNLIEYASTWDLLLREQGFLDAR